MTLALGALAGLGRNTITGMLCTTGQQFRDWSAAYRLFSTPRFEPDCLFGVARAAVAQELEPQTPYCAAIDDTLLRKTGKRVYGAGWRRDPLGPPFQTNLVWGQRFVQIAAALPDADQPGPALSIPIDFLHAPTPNKPKEMADEEVWKKYREECKTHNLSLVAAQRIQLLRRHLDADGQAARTLWVSGDGGYTNETVLKQLPERTVFIGRIRKDAKLYYPPGAEPENVRGRKPSYGLRAPTPEQLRTDETLPWHTVTAWAAGKKHEFRVKTLARVQWRTAGHTTLLRLVVIAPLGYRLRKGSRLLYRQPAYLICTDPQAPLEKVLQAYLWRWGIEVNHRDEKQLIGVGQAQVRAKNSVNHVPALLVASYSLLRLAAYRAYRIGPPLPEVPPPRWYPNGKPQPPSMSRVTQQLRAELWGKALGLNSSGFPAKDPNVTKPEKRYPDLASAVLYTAN